MSRVVGYRSGQDRNEPNALTHTYAMTAGELRLCLTGQFFPNLWGQAAIFPDQRSAYLGTLSTVPSAGAVLFVPLDPHLVVVSQRAPPEELQGHLPLVTQVGTSR